MPTYGSLFSGIGGFDLGLDRAGWECRWQVEINAFCQRVLARHWPTVARYGDITTLDLERIERVDLLCGGFPCQPVSIAGKGLAQADARWLWPEFARVIRALRPRYVLVENVPGLLGRGFGDVVGDLAACGYDAEWDCIPAAAVGAPHLRDRVWLVAYAYGAGYGLQQVGELGGGDPAGPADDGAARLVADGQWSAPRYLDGADQLREWTTHWDIESGVGRVADGVPQRLDRLRGLGNAIVPQIAEWIGRRLMNWEVTRWTL